MKTDEHKQKEGSVATKSYYIPNCGEYRGMDGELVGGISNPSHNEVELLFENGERRWFRYIDVNLTNKEHKQ